MNKGNDQVKEAIKSYLDDRAGKDELFAKAYAKENKNIDECLNYILGEARKKGNAVYMSDEEVFSLAVHYYDEDTIKISPIPKNETVRATASKPAPVQLSEEDMEKARDEAIKQYTKECIDKLKAADEAKAKRESEKKKAAREAKAKSQQYIPNLFSFGE